MALIRPACTADIPRLLALYEELSLVTTRAEQSHCPTPSDYEGALARIHSTPGYSLLVVDSRSRNLGLGTLLVKHAVDRARAAGCDKLVLDSNKKRFNAHRFYRSLGFRMHF